MSRYIPVAVNHNTVCNGRVSIDDRVDKLERGEVRHQGLHRPQLLLIQQPASMPQYLILKKTVFFEVFFLGKLADFKCVISQVFRLVY